MRFVELEYGNIVIEFATEFDVFENGGNYAAYKVDASLISEDFEAFGFELFSDNFGSSSFAVGARYNYDTIWQFGQYFADEFWIRALNYEARQGGAAVTTETSYFLDAFAE